jgi:hypothetical protein
MEYLDNEMDDLFRKAGEHYPLKTSDSDWDAVLGRLQPPAGTSADAESPLPKKRPNKNRRFFWLLLLLPLGFFGAKYFSGGGEHKAIAKTDQVQVNTEKDQTGNESAPAVSGDQKKTAASGSTGFAGPEPAERSATAGSTEARALPELRNRTSNAPAAPLKGYDKKNRNNQQQESDQSDLPDKSNHPPATGSDVANPAEAKKQQAADADLTGDANSSTLPSAVDSRNRDKSELPAAKNQAPPGGNNAGEKNSPVQPEKPEQTVREKDSAAASASDRQKKPAKLSSKKEKGVYISLLAGPDFSTVKLQSVKKMGYSFGLSLGYRFNRHISLESGVYWDKKQYYSDGKYFDKSKTNIPRTVEINDIDGDCSMFEIPVSFRYDFGFGRKGRFFSTVGLNSYIMKKENYDYTTNDYPGWYRKVSYNNSSNNLFSVLQLSAGYEYSLGKIGRIRVEPYLNIPFNGVGIGSMPISSAGLHLGLTVPFR